MKISYTGYDRPLDDNICIAMCYFNPLEYAKPLRNVRLIQEQFEKYDIPYYIVELIYPHQVPVIKNATIVRSSSILFSKENLWNVVEKTIPEKYQKLVFMDADIVCSDPAWINNISTLLNHNDMVHGMDYLYRDINDVHEVCELDCEKAKFSLIKAIKNNIPIDLRVHHTGYVTALNRSFFHEIGGIFEYGITGYGDVLFWAAFIKGFEPNCDNFLKMPRFKSIRHKWHEYKQNALAKTSMDRIAYLPGANMIHLRHGQQDNRKYPKRNHYVAGIFDLFHNDDGVLEISVKNIQSPDLRQYWIDRREDE